MPFSISHSQAGQTQLVHLHDEDRITATIIPSAGAMLHALTIHSNGKNIDLIDSYPSGLAAESTGDWFKGVKLSPWPCRIPAGEFVFNNKKYKLSKLFRDGTALHGLLFDQSFKIVDEFANEKTATLKVSHDYLGEDVGYPFRYRCEVNYVLHSENRLEIETTVINTSDTEIPIGDGWHPYFQLGGKVDDWQLQFPGRSIVEFDERLIPTGNLLPYHQFNQLKTIGPIELDNSFLIDMTVHKRACTVKNPLNGLAIHFFADENYPYLQIFIPPHRNSIAIENLSCAPNAFNNGMGLKILAPNQSSTFRVFYKVEVNEMK